LQNLPIFWTDETNSVGLDVLRSISSSRFGKYYTVVNESVIWLSLLGASSNMSKNLHTLNVDWCNDEYFNEFTENIDYILTCGSKLGLTYRMIGYSTGHIRQHKVLVNDISGFNDCEFNINCSSIKTSRNNDVIVCGEKFICQPYELLVADYVMLLKYIKDSKARSFVIYSLYVLSKIQPYYMRDILYWIVIREHSITHVLSVDELKMLNYIPNLIDEGVIADVRNFIDPIYRWKVSDESNRVWDNVDRMWREYVKFMTVWSFNKR